MSKSIVHIIIILLVCCCLTSCWCRILSYQRSYNPHLLSGGDSSCGVSYLGGIVHRSRYNGNEKEYVTLNLFLNSDNEYKISRKNYYYLRNGKKTKPLFSIRLHEGINSLTYNLKRDSSDIDTLHVCIVNKRDDTKLMDLLFEIDESNSSLVSNDDSLMLEHDKLELEVYRNKKLHGDEDVDDLIISLLEKTVIKRDSLISAKQAIIK